MPPSDHAAPAATGAPAGVASESLASALRALYRAYQKTSIYPQSHPAVPQAVCAAAGAFREALRGRAGVVLRVKRDRLFDDELEISEATGSVQALAGLVHDLDVATIRIADGFEDEEIERLVRILGCGRADGIRGERLVALHEATTDEEREGEESRARHVSLTPIDYGALRFDDGLRDDDADDDAVWDRLSRTLGDAPPDEPDDPDAEALAAEVSREIERHESAGLGVLRTRMRHLNREMKGMSADQRAAIRRRLAQFVSALNPRLRYDLLRVDPKGSGDDLEFLGEIADVVPETDLLEALQEIDRAGGRVPSELMTLMNKLVRISHSRPSLASGLRDTLTKWGVQNTGLTPDAGDLQAALEELFQRRSKFQANPEPYQLLLDDLARRSVGGERYDGYRDRYRDPRDADDVRMHAAELAVRLLGNTRGGHYRAGVFGYVSTVTSQLIERGRVELLQDAAVAARACASLEREPESARLAAEGFLGEFAVDHRINRILGRARRTGEISEAALSLLELGGERATDAVVEVLASGSADALRRPLVEFARQRPAAELQPALERRLDRAADRLVPLLPLIRSLPTAAASPMLEKLCTHADAGLRRLALRALAQTEVRADVVERWLLRGLEDRKRLVASEAIARLADLGSPRALETLHDYVACRLDRVDPVPSLGRRAAAGLLRHGDDGRALLVAAVRSLAYRVQPRAVSMALAVAPVLESQRGHREVVRALRRVRWSWVGLVRAVSSLGRSRARG